MRKVKEVLRLRFELGLGQRQIARSCGMGLGTVHEYLERAVAAGIGWPLPEGLSEEELEAKLFGNQPVQSGAVRPQPDWNTIHQQLRQHRHLTLQLLWEEYRQAHPEGYRYSWFCERYQHWRRHLDVVLRQEHKAGEKMFVDWAGATIPVYDSTTGKRPTYATVYRILTNPIYGGAYAYGKTERTPHYENGEPRRGARRKPREQWLALIPNSHEGYVSWEQHQQIRQAIAENVRGGEPSGIVQGGAALMAGLLRCRRCGRKLAVSYTGNHHDVLRYECRRGWLDSGEPRCIGFGGMPVDETIAQEVLRVVQPAAVEAAVLASQAEARKQDEVLEAWGRDLEAARYAAQRAQKQYDAADPENRLVADELERRWNQALQRVQEIELRVEQQVHGQGKASTATREEYEELATKLETVWNCADTDVRLKKRIVRTLIHEVVVDVDAEAGELILALHWKGGVHTELRLPRRRRGQNSKQTPKEIVAAVRTLARICSDEVIAGALNRNGLLTGRGNRWTKEGVTSLRSHHQIPSYGSDRRQTEG